MSLLSLSRVALLPALALAGLASLALVAPSAHAQTVVTADRGWYTQNGLHNPANTNYLVGRNETALQYRNFFVFDIPMLAAGQEYKTAAFSFNTFGITTPDGSETVVFNDYTGSITALVDGTGGLAAYNDLGGGTTYGTISVTPAQSNTIATVTFTDAGVAAINAARGGQFAFGGYLSSLSGTSNQEFVDGFSAPGTPADTSLSLTSGAAATAVPEPGEWAVMGMLGTSVCGLMIRARRKASTSRTLANG